jgi:hypothetical protein
MTTALHRDPAGFPMMWVPEIEAFLHWLPVTKIQFEHFLCDASDRSFDALWYEDLLRLNPRVSPAQIDGSNYWRAFLTGILPAEAQRFAYWCGDGYRLPTAWEWSRAYEALAGTAPQDPGRLGLIGISRSRVDEVILRLEQAGAEVAGRLGYDRRACDQALMRLGILEWVRRKPDETSWVVLGEPFPAFVGNLLVPDLGALTVASNGDARRMPWCGFRLVYTPLGSGTGAAHDEARKGRCPAAGSASQGEGE